MFFQGGVATVFENWPPGEPNDWSNEDYAHVGAPFGNWNDRTFSGEGLVTGYYVEFETAGIQDDSYATVGLVGAGVTSVTDAAVSSGVTYEYRALAVGAEGDSAPSGVLVVAVP